MDTNRNEVKDRLKQLMAQKGITSKQLASLCHLSEDSIKGYKRTNTLPLEHAEKIADEYNVTLDWLYGRSEYQSETDIMVDIMLALEKVFHFTAKKDKSGDTYPVLLIDRTFYEYITDLQKLQHFKTTAPIAKNTYANARREIYNKYQEEFHRIFGITGFNEEAAIEIRNFEGVTVADILGYAMEKNEDR